MWKPSIRPVHGSLRNASRRVLVGLVVLGSVSGIVASGAGRAAAEHVRSGLPPGWELCVLRGVGGHVTDANLADLDTWQLAEGGATENGIAYNPFNTRRGTDQAGASLPASYTANGFPIFANWAAGCAATVATILQPNMTAIAKALDTGTVAPAKAFLSAVNTTPWCAPSDGTPCYSELISSGLSVAGTQARGVLHSAQAALTAYDQDVAAQQDAQAALAADQDQLDTATIEVVFARMALQHATDVLRSLAIYEYTSNPSLDHMASLLGRFHPPSQSDLLSQYYLGLDAGAEVTRYHQAQSVLTQASATRTATSAAVTRATATLAQATAVTARALSAAGAQLATLEHAAACPGAPPTPGSGGGSVSVSTLRTCLGSLLT